jgi:DNA-binding MarR family transcriptional regulator
MSLRYPRRKQHVRLTDHGRRAVRWFRRWAKRTQAQLARQFNVSQPTISNILRSST